MSGDETAAQVVLPTILQRRALERPERLILQIIDGPSLTYRDLDTLGRRWAAGLRRLGVSEGDRVATLLPPGVDAYAAWLGTGWLRALDVGVNVEYRGAMLTYLLQNCEARVAIVDATLLPRLVDILDQVPKLQAIVVSRSRLPLPQLPLPCCTVEELLTDAQPLADAIPPRPRDTCAVIYTSGTTGPSKGVLFPWAEMFASACGTVPLNELSAEDAFYSTAPMHHGSGRLPLLLMAMCGGRLVVRERFSGSAFWDDVRRHGCTITALIGAMSSFLWAQPVSDEDSDNALRVAVMFPLLPQLREFESRFGIKVRTLYAMTETGPVIGSGWSPADPLSCGVVQPGYELRIVDDDDYEVPEGAVGELIVRADRPWMLNAGYLGMPDATAHAWRNGWFHTGDALRRDAAGNYFFIDRIKDAIRRRGENISSFEVESHVNSHEDIVESAAVAVASEWGEDEVKVVAVRRPDSDLEHSALIEFLANRMPRFMVPRYLEFVDELPKTEATQRVRKVELRAAGITDETWDRETTGMKLEL